MEDKVNEFLPTIDAFWSNIKKKADLARDYGVCFDDNAKKVFESAFVSEYQSIQETYMHGDVAFLDRHKVAAILIVSFLNSRVISHNKSFRGRPVFLGAEIIVTEVALDWMLAQFNRKLESNHLNPIRHYTMPEAYACETPYFDIFCRSLYYCKRDGYRLNPIDIAEKLYLIEYITMLSANIPQSALKE